MKKTQERICIKCGGKMPVKIISKAFDVNGKKTIVKNIRAYICEKCGETVYSYPEAQKIENIIHGA